jgi:AhpC/TSA family
MALLRPGDTFPQLTLNIPGAQAIQVPAWFADQFGVVLFNRGSWCPYCTAQLRAFQRAGESLTPAGVRVAALWVDDEDGGLFAVAHDDRSTVADVGGTEVHGVPPSRSRSAAGRHTTPEASKGRPALLNPAWPARSAAPATRKAAPRSSPAAPTTCPPVGTPFENHPKGTATTVGSLPLS